MNSQTNYVMYTADGRVTGNVQRVVSKERMPLVKECMAEVLPIVRNAPHTVLIAYLCQGLEELQAMYDLKRELPHVQVLVLLPGPELDVVLECGRRGIDKVLLHGQMSQLDQVLLSLSANSIRVTLGDVGIDAARHEGIAQKTLLKIQDDYRTLMGIKDISNCLGIHESSISREFKKNKLTSPKKLLMMFKVMHAIRLLESPGLSVKEIAYQSGFTHEKRFIECFNRFLGLSPNLFREQKQLLLQKG